MILKVKVFDLCFQCDSLHLNFSQSVGEKLKAAKTDGDAIQILQITAKCGKSKSD